jgi:hypothetical protein
MCVIIANYSIVSILMMFYFALYSESIIRKVTDCVAIIFF